MVLNNLHPRLKVRKDSDGAEDDTLWFQFADGTWIQVIEEQYSSINNETADPN